MQTENRHAMAVAVLGILAFSPCPVRAQAGPSPAEQAPTQPAESGRSAVGLSGNTAPGAPPSDAGQTPGEQGARPGRIAKEPAEETEETAGDKEEDRQPSAADFLVQGERHFRAGRHQRAVGCYEKAISMSPGNARAYMLLGRARMVMGDSTAAIDALKAGVQLQPGNAEYRVALGDAYLAICARWNAIGSFRKALVLDPGNADARNGIAAARRPCRIMEVTASPRSGATSPWKPEFQVFGRVGFSILSFDVGAGIRAFMIPPALNWKFGLGFIWEHMFLEEIKWGFRSHPDGIDDFQVELLANHVEDFFIAPFISFGRYQEFLEFGRQATIGAGLRVGWTFRSEQHTLIHVEIPLFEYVNKIPDRGDEWGFGTTPASNDDGVLRFLGLNLSLGAGF